MNISSKGPVTISTTPADVFDRNSLENLGVRAILSAGIGDHEYQDRMFSSRITMPKYKDRMYEALIFNFIVLEDSKQITLKINSKALTLLILIYPKKFRKYVNRFEEDLELILSQSNILPRYASELIDSIELNAFINTIRKTIITFETESLLNFEEFEINTIYEEGSTGIVSTTFLDELV